MTHTKQCASGSVVEHLLAKEGVAGSIPVSRFSYAIKMGTLTGAHFYCISEPGPGLESSISRLPPRSLLLCFAKRCPQDTRNPSRAFFAFFKGYSRVFDLFVLYFVLYKRARSRARRFDFSASASIVAFTLFLRNLLAVRFPFFPFSMVFY